MKKITGLSKSLCAVTLVFVQAILGIAIAPARADAATGVVVPSMSQCDTLSQNFINTYGIQGMNIAISYQGRLIYSRGFGRTTASATSDLVQPYHRMRLASVSKSLTATAIMKLVETGQLSLDDTVFGAAGILGSDPYFASGTITDARMNNVTVRNLLEHAAGWNPALAVTPSPLPPYSWGFPYTDPASFPLYVTQALGETNPGSRRSTVKWPMQRPLDSNPGTVYQYSNVGYAILAQIIEAKTGMSFVNYLQSALFAPINANDFAVAGSLLADKKEREVEYVGTGNTLSSWGTGQMVPWQYGGTIYESVDGGGGMMGTSSDLVRLLNAVDGYPTKPDILTIPTLTTMTTPPAFNSNYAKGWGVTPSGFVGNWNHSGQLQGTATNIWRLTNGINFSVVMNEVGTGNFRPTMNGLGQNCFNTATAIPAHDLSDVPDTAASGVSVTEPGSTSMKINWTPGNGTGRVVVMRAATPANMYPLDGTDYTVPQNGPYPTLGNNNMVVYSGTGNTVTVTGLMSGTTYHYRIYEFNKSANTGNHALYQLGRNAGGSGTTAPPTSAPASISGVVRHADGRAIAKVLVRLADSSGNIVGEARSSSFGYFRIGDVPTGTTYVLTGVSKREHFTPVVVTLSEDVNNADLVANTP